MKNACQIACALLLVVAACGPIADPSGRGLDRRHIIALGSQRIDTRTTPVSAGSDLALVKFPGPVTAEQIAALAASAQIYTYLPHGAFLVRPRAGATQLAASPAGASWMGAYRPEYKISRMAAD